VVHLLRRSGKINWLFENLPFEPDEDFLKDFVGFVYCITDPDGKKYIGKKFFWSTRRLPPLKGTKMISDPALRGNTRVQQADQSAYNE